MMIWHIFQKDWRLLWRAVVVVGLANVLQRAMLSRAEQLADATLLQLATSFGFVVLIASAVLIVVLVHQDPLPGLCQDWLVRPIRRVDLLLGKLLFVVLLVQGPICLAEVGQGLMAGLPFWTSAGAALSRSCWMVIAIDLPCVALAAVTRNLVQTIGAALAAALGFIVILGIYLFFLFNDGAPALIRSAPIAWVGEMIQTAWGLLAVAVVLTYQYRRRKTLRVSWTLGAAALIWILMELLPWRTAFAIQERLSGQPRSVSAVQIDFGPEFGKRPGPAPNPESMRVVRNVPERAAFLFVPLRVSGLGTDERLLVDKTSVRIVGPDGNAIELSPRVGPTEFRQPPIYQLITVQEAGYGRVKDQPLRMEIDYSLSLLKANPEQTMPALAGDRWIPDMGRCTAGADPSGAQIDVHCVVAGPLPCTDWFLENKRTGLRGPRAKYPQSMKGLFQGPACFPDYAPYAAGIGSDPSVRFIAYLPLGRLVEASRLEDAQLVSLVYHPEAHFTRHVVVRDIRLGDWRAE